MSFSCSADDFRMEEVQSSLNHDPPGVWWCVPAGACLNSDWRVLEEKWQHLPVPSVLNLVSSELLEFYGEDAKLLESKSQLFLTSRVGQVFPYLVMFKIFWCHQEDSALICPLVDKLIHPPSAQNQQKQKQLLVYAHMLLKKEYDIWEWRRETDALALAPPLGLVSMATGPGRRPDLASIIRKQEELFQNSTGFSAAMWRRNSLRCCLFS